MSARTGMRLIMMGTVAVLSQTLVACGDKAPEGQVVATVDGKEVTLPELNAEAQAANVPDGADKKQVLPVILQRVIDRKLLVKVAQEKGIDKSADYLVQKRRMEELLLAEMAAKQQVSALAVPTSAEVDKFMADNPAMFAGRTRYQLQQIVFPRPNDVKVLQQLQPANSMAEVAAVLTKLGIKFQQGTDVLDSAAVPAEIMARIKSLPPTEPFVLPKGPFLTVNTIVGSQPVAIEPAQAKQMAVEALRQQRAAKSLDDTVKAARSAAKIEYKEGFAPPAPGAAPKPGAAPAAALPAAPVGNTN